MDTVNDTTRFLSAPKAKIDASALVQAKEVLAKLSLEEKVSFLAGNGTMTIAAHPQVGQDDELWFSDGPHTVRPEIDRATFNPANTDDDHSTVLPTLSALAASWNTELAEEFGRTLGREARHRGKDVQLGPGVNLLRTPLNGRNYEYMGEDPILAGRLATAYVHGLQSQNVAACLKHFAGNEQELERTSVDTEIDERALRELYLLPFEMAIVEGGALTVMNGYNRFRGEFCSHNDYLNNQVLKREWNFPGFVVSDWGGVHDTVAGALGGLDVEMHAGDAIQYFREPLIDAVNIGEVPEKTVDNMALRVLYVMAQLGKLGGYRRAKGARNTPEHQAFARKVAAESIVLLKNDSNRLPLKRKDTKRILVLGSNANIKHSGGGWSAEGKPPYEITPLQGLRDYLGNTAEIEYIPGPFKEIHSQLPESYIQTIDTNDLDHGAAQKGWQVVTFPTSELTGIPVSTVYHHECNHAQAPNTSSRWSIEITAPEDGVYSFQIEHDGPVCFYIDGDLYIDAWSSESSQTSSCTAQLSSKVTYTLTIEHSPLENKGNLKFGWRTPSCLHPTLPEELVKRSQSADTVLFFTGNQLGAGHAHEGEGSDRPSMALPEGDDEAITSLLAARPDTVVITQSGSPVSMPWIKSAPTLVHYWFSGMEGGAALAGLLFGEANPSGKLPFSIPRQLEDTPAHALGNYGPERVNYQEGVFIGYRWHDKKKIPPLFPFGHGLSYTTFSISPPQLDKTEIPHGSNLTIRTKVTNTGNRAGSEVLQLYLGSTEAAVQRPIRELKAFRKVELQPGETTNIEFTLTPRDFAYWDVEANAWRVDAGTYSIEIGKSSSDLSVPKTIYLY
ncbi:beta-glucosidase [Pelagicoccus mobilis]|uniref:Glycoside hydrolase family 3 C-terminal domain-containing protein n=1 Tax=Pelagicoccus mobilis TaxID=415221 RepID=A0A934RZD9_9BACT|nr:glycoside hydrolase family 3 C-terminal domain-containing protein [Pelagicoccus mobilis]MBK1878340.1 glycoside hydrolase family 3 C-terminal domain-containing protein [Pelagicoccus mobilis]